MCLFYNAYLFEITGAAKGVFTHAQSSCHIAKVVLTIRHDSRQIPIASDARPFHTSRGFLHWRFAYAGPQRARRTTFMGPASANLHNSGSGEHFRWAPLMITRPEARGTSTAQRVDPSDQLGFMPFDLMIATAAGPLRYSMRALAAVVSWVSDPTAAVNTTFCCSSAGNGPTTSKPGAVRTLIRNMPNSTSPLATTATTCAGLGCALIFAFIGSVMPRRSNTFAIE